MAIYNITAGERTWTYPAFKLAEITDAGETTRHKESLALQRYIAELDSGTKAGIAQNKAVSDTEKAELDATAQANSGADKLADAVSELQETQKSMVEMMKIFAEALAKVTTPAQA